MVTLTRRGLLARAGQLAPLAAAAGMFGRFSVPIAQPIEQELLPDAVPMREAMVGWVEGLPVYDSGLVGISERNGLLQMVIRAPGQMFREAASFGDSVLVRLQDGKIARWQSDAGGAVIPGLAARFTPVLRLR